MDESGRTDLEIEGISDAVGNASSSSTTCDNRSTESQTISTNSEPLGIDVEKLMDNDDGLLEFGRFPQLTEEMEPTRTRKVGKCNLRNSLAWDTTFFTSAGILDPDELSSMIEGADKGGKHFLPGIEEDIRRSNDTISTLDSDNLTLEHLEADLFEDIRASIQKSSKSSKMETPSKVGYLETESKATSSIKKVDFPSKNVVKPNLTTKKKPIVTQGPGKLTKQSSGISQGMQCAVKHGGLTSSLQKTSNIVGSPNPILSATPLKRASLGANQVKMEKDKAKVNSKVAPGPKTLGLGSSGRILPKPALPSKSSTSSSSTAIKKLPPKASSSDSSGSILSADVGISPVKSTRRKKDSRTVNPTASSSMLKVPLKVALKKKGNNPSSNSKSSNLSSNSSPASSISEWSTESCSSTSTVNQRYNITRASIDSRSSCISLENYTPPAVDCCNQSADRSADRLRNKVSHLPGEKVKTSSMHVGEPFQPATVKPSGLRMPSPKLGFFEGVKTAVRTPTRNVQSHSGIPAGPRIGPGISSSSSGGSGKGKPAKLQPAKLVMGSGKMKIEGQKPSSPMPNQKPSKATLESTSAADIKNSLTILPEEVQNEKDGENCVKAMELVPGAPDKANNVPDTDLDAKKNENLDGPKSEQFSEKQDVTKLKDDKIASVEVDTIASNSPCNAENKFSEEVGEDAISDLQHLKNILHSLRKSNDKENAHLDGQADGLGKHGDAESSIQDLQKKYAGNSIPQSDFNSPYSKEFIHGKNFESQTNFSLPNSVLPPVTMELTANTRSPFSVKNSFCSNAGFDNSPKLPEKTATPPFLESAQTENT